MPAHLRPALSNCCARATAPLCWAMLITCWLLGFQTRDQVVWTRSLLGNARGQTRRMANDTQESTGKQWDKQDGANNGANKTRKSSDCSDPILKNRSMRLACRGAKPTKTPRHGRRSTWRKLVTEPFHPIAEDQLSIEFGQAGRQIWVYGLPAIGQPGSSGVSSTLNSLGSSVDDLRQSARKGPRQ